MSSEKTQQQIKEMTTIYQRELRKKDDKQYFELKTVRGSREVTKSTIIIHDFMC